MGEREEKSCPFCKETIKAEAIKCRFCGEFIEDDPQTTLNRQIEGGEPAESENKTLDSSTKELMLSKLVLLPQLVKFSGWFLVSVAVGTGVFFADKHEKLGFWKHARLTGWSICAALAVIGLCIFWIRYLKYKNHQFSITPDRIECRHGLFSRTVSNIEMWRIQDIRLVQPFTQRMFGVGTVIVESTDPSDPYLEIGPVAKANKLYKELREAAVNADRKRGVVHLDS